MTRRGQATLLVLLLCLPAALLAVIALALLGARAQAERAQRLADTAALTAAVALPVHLSVSSLRQRLDLAPGDTLQLIYGGSTVQAVVMLNGVRIALPLSQRAAVIQPTASSRAEPITRADGGRGAVRVE